MSDTGLVPFDNVISPEIIIQEGAGKAYQAVAQSSSLAIQDAVDNLRNINTIITTAIGVATAQMLSQTITPDQFTTFVTNTQLVATNAVTNFSSIGTNAASVLNGFPPSKV